MTGSDDGAWSARDDYDAQVRAWSQAGRAPTADRVAQLVAGRAAVLGDEGAANARRTLAARVLGAGPLEPLLTLPGVTDVLVNGPDGVWVDDGNGLRRVACDVGGPEDVRRLAVRLVGLTGRRLDDASPYVDGRLPGGVRLHAILPPLVASGAHISLRVPHRTAPRLDELAAGGSMPPAWVAVLRAMVRSRCSYVVTGGTGSGKTTLLAALLGEVGHDERVVIVEDVRELAVVHPHAVRLEARAPNVEGRGGIDMVALVRQSLRMRPDRLVVGEVRGGEVRELLTALNTGHEGGAGTLHANAVNDVVVRFEALGALAGLSPEATRAQLTSAVEVVVHLRRAREGRRVEAIAVLERLNTGLRAVPALGRGIPDGTAPGWGRLAERLRLTGPLSTSKDAP
ncbi:MAG: TadA family conjugal transfer-associated ATPase [Dermatophilaceae bacterium]